jgi:hypothetical protein
MIVMKHLAKFFCIFICSFLLFTSCHELDNPVTPVNPPVTGAYIIGTAKYYNSGYYELTNYNFVYPSKDPYGNTVMLSGTITMGPEVTKNTVARGLVLYNHYSVFKAEECPSLGKLDVQKQLQGSGLITVAPDYYGFGSTEDHQQAYCMARHNARASMDALIAAKQLLAQEGYRFGDALFNVGFSQGAQTAIGVLRLVSEEYPEIHFTRTMAGSGPYDLTETYRQLIQQDAKGISSNAVCVLLAYNEYAQLGFSYGDLFSEPLRSHVNDWVLSKAYDREEMDKLIGEQTKLSECLAPELLDMESAVGKRLVEAFEADNLCKGWKPRPEENILLFHSTVDMTVPCSNTDLLYQFLKDQGVENVELIEGRYGGLFGTGAHTFSSLTFISEVKKWLCDYFGIPEW